MKTYLSNEGQEGGTGPSGMGKVNGKDEGK
jgi:hypothetical protein